MARPGWIDRARAAMPTREYFEKIGWLRPFAHRILAPALWRFTRRSVPRGVALGMITGVLAPVAQIPLSALLAFPLRANIPAAALTTFVTNPLTTPPIWIAAYWIGRQILRIDAQVPGQPISTGMATANRNWIDWLLVDAGPATLTGLVTIAVAGAVLGYAATAIGWRIWIIRKWKRSRPRHVD